MSPIHEPAFVTAGRLRKRSVDLVRPEPEAIGYREGYELIRRDVR